MEIRPIEAEDRDWVCRLLGDTFGSSQIVSRGILHDGGSLPGFLAQEPAGPTGLLLYRMSGGDCEVVVLISLHQGTGVGTALLAEAENVARDLSCRRLWLVTTNDNRRAIEFYRNRGWRQVAIHRGAVAAARLLKPEIPERGEDGTPIEDEIEFERTL